MKIIVLFIISALVVIRPVQAVEPYGLIVTPVSEGTSVTVDVQTVPVATSTVPATVVTSFPDIVIDVVAARQHLADKIATSTSNVDVPAVTTSAEELREYAAFFTGAHLAIQALTIRTEDIQLGYTLPAKFLFFIPVNYTALITINRAGQLQSFAKPWWLWLVQDQAGATKMAVSAVLDKLVIALADSSNPQPSLYLLKQKQLSVVLAALKKITEQ